MRILISIFILSISQNYTGGFREGDWVVYGNFRFVTSVAMDQNTVYFGTTTGVIRYDRYAKSWLYPLTVADGIPHERVDNIAFDPATGRIWVTTPGGTAYYQPTFRQWYSGGEFPVDLARNDFDPDNFPILTTEWGYSYQNGIVRDLNMREFPITGGVKDDYDLMYVGTWGMGPAIINTRYGDLNTLSFGPYSSELSTILEVGKELWMGDTRLSIGGLSVYNRAGGKWRWFLPQYTNGLISSDLTSGISASDKSGAIWLGTDYGLIRYQPENNEFTAFADFSSLPSVSILSVAVDNLGVFVGTDNGLGFIPDIREPENKKRSKFSDSGGDNDSTALSIPFPVKSLNGYRINSLEVIGNYIYLGTNYGVMRRLLADNSQFEYVNTPDKMLSVEINDIVRDSDSLLFVTPRDIQIVSLATEESSTLTDHRYFDQWRLRRVVADSANIWAATDIGLWKYRRADGYSRLFTVNDGMISDDIRGLVLDGDYIWLATPRGLIRFYWNNPARID